MNLWNLNHVPPAPMTKMQNSGASMGFTLRCGNSTNNAGCQTVQMLVRAGETEARGGSYVNSLICTYTIFQTVTFKLMFSCKIFIYALKTFL